MKQLLTLTGFFIILLVSLKTWAQNVFSEKILDYKKTILPYDLPAINPVEGRNFILLEEQKKNVLKTGRYDQYFFEQWIKSITFDQKESVPQFLAYGDTLLIFRLTPLKDHSKIKVSFDLIAFSGAETGKMQYEIPYTFSDRFIPKIIFSPDRSMFMVYNFLGTGENSSQVQFHIFRVGETTAFSTHTLSDETFPDGIQSNVYLEEDGDLLLTLINAFDYKITTCYWTPQSNEPSRIEGNFFLERPPSGIGGIEIIQQGASSYMIAFAANIENELIGYSVLGVNVVLKTVMFSNNLNFKQDEINQLYTDYLITGEKQKKKHLKIPVKLNNFRLIRGDLTSENNIILTFEELARPVWHHQSYYQGSMPWKIRYDEDKYLFGGDLLFYCLNPNGEIIWKKTIQKTQYSKGATHGLSMIPRFREDRLDMIMHESSKGGNTYMLSLNTTDGSLREKINLLPGNKHDFVKKYSCWLDDRAALLCITGRSSQNKRKLLLVEF